jgi:hypothetical protein
MVEGAELIVGLGLEEEDQWLLECGDRGPDNDNAEWHLDG